MTIHIYQDLAGGWRWRLVAKNGRIVADGAESYSSRGNVMRALNTLPVDDTVVTVDATAAK